MELNMRQEFWITKALEIIIVLLIVIAGFGQAVLQLWNLLMPGIFGLHRITFWQAVGLMGLSWILFGGFRGLLSMPSSRHRTRRWDRMTPEQREQFQKAMQERGRGCRAPVEAKP
jgi:hypothetical protein